MPDPFDVLAIKRGPDADVAAGDVGTQRAMIRRGLRVSGSDVTNTTIDCGNVASDVAFMSQSDGHFRAILKYLLRLCNIQLSRAAGLKA